MLLEMLKHAVTECDGCGVHGHGPAPRGWYDRSLDPPHYSGPRRLLICPRCFAALPSAQQRRWRCLGRPRSALRMVTTIRPLLRLPAFPKRGPVG
jgi:hypothetical protein